MLNSSRIDDLLQQFPAKSVGVLGDLFLDRYLDLDGRLTEPSLETGLDAYQVVRVRAQPGAAGTIINNLAALGVGRILPVAVIGDDGEGYELRQALARMPAVDSTHVMSWPGRRTPTYTKPMLEYPDSAPRELNRLDIKNRTATPSATESAIIAAMEKAWNKVDAWIVLDQVSEPDCGVVTARVRDWLAQRAQENPERFVLADSRERIALFRNVCMKPNEREAADISTLSHLAQRPVFWTRGERGIWLLLPGQMAPIPVPAFPVSGPLDIVGAGDSVSAGIAAAISAGASFEDSASFGNLVASITIQQIGTTGTASPDQVRQRWREVSDLLPGGADVG